MDGPETPPGIGIDMGCIGILGGPPGVVPMGMDAMGMDAPGGGGATWPAAMGRGPPLIPMDVGGGTIETPGGPPPLGTPIL